MAFKFETLEIWKLAIEYSDGVYDLTEKFPDDERFGLTAQTRRSSSSVPANMAEGSGGSSVKDFQNYLDIAIKSVYEAVSHLVLAKKRQAEKLVRKIKAFRCWLDERGKF